MVKSPPYRNLPNVIAKVMVHSRNSKTLPSQMINYRLATRDDNQQLIELTAATGMTGDISLRIDRKPDFFELLKMRGETQVFIALADNMIIGSLCVSLQQVYIGGHVYPQYYIADFKILEKYRSKGIGMQLCNELANYLVPLGADLVFLNIAKGNKKPISFFKNRPNLPDFENIGCFNIHQFIGKKSKTLDQPFKIEISDVSDEVVHFLNNHYRTYELGSVITKEKLKGISIFTISRADKIVAAMCISDTMGVKQNVVTNLSLSMRFTIRIINFFSKPFRLSRMPLLNEPVRMMYIKYLAVNNNESLFVKLLINKARDIVHLRAYSFVSIGLHEKDPLNKCFKGIFKLTFHSVGMFLSIKNNKELMQKVKQGIPFEDFSIV